MATPSDSPPPSSRSPAADPAPAPRVIPLAERRRRVPARSPTEELMHSLLASDRAGQTEGSGVPATRRGP